MEVANPNARAMRVFAEALRAAGVGDVVVSPGSRSTAAALALVQSRVRPWVVTDERAAGFFALGMARASGRPVALLCTSGTAAANYLPAVVEASLSEIPLVVLTADRPPELRDCQAAQTIDQVRLFGSHVRWSVDAATPAPGLDLEAYFRMLAARAAATALDAPRGPVHLNLPMREPLLDVADERRRGAGGTDGAPGGARPLRVHAGSGLPPPAVVGELASALAARRRGLLVCGPKAAGDAATARALVALAERLDWPLLADPLSGVRFARDGAGSDAEGESRSASSVCRADERAPRLAEPAVRAPARDDPATSGARSASSRIVASARVVDAYDVLIQGGVIDAAWHPDAVVHLGAPTVSAPLQRLLAAARAPLHVVVAPAGRWPDPILAATDVVRADAGALAAALVDALPEPHADTASAWTDAWCVADAAARTALDDLLAREATLFEGTVLATVVAGLGDAAVLHVGNSLPVRALDAFVGGAGRGLTVACNRGASGIDGVVASALGASAVDARPTALVVGDLSFLHDVGALQIASRHRIPLLVVVVNNDGGGIFSFLPQARLEPEQFETLFGTPHGLAVEGAVAMCGGRYVRAERREALAAAVDAWRAAPAFTVIEVPTDRAASRALHARLIADACRAVAARGALPDVSSGGGSGAAATRRAESR